MIFLTWLTNLFQSYGITMFSKYYKFHKLKIISIIFWVYLHFLVHIIFCHKYTLESHNISWKKNNSLWLNSLCYNLPYYVKKLEKYVPILPWLKFKHGHPWKTIQCDNIFAPPCPRSVFSSISSSNQAFLEHAREISYNPQKDLSNNVLHASIGDNLTFALRGFVVGNQILNLTPILFFYHNSCISGLNEQCEGTLGI
jgi:hypothetical protein